jgi:hypothetical protein
VDTSESDQKYALRSLPDNLTGLELVSAMYVAILSVGGEQDVGFELSREYQAALEIRQNGQAGLRM